MVRSSITLLTSIHAGNDGPEEQRKHQPKQRMMVAANVISVNGSARTAKLATIASVRKLYRELLPPAGGSVGKKELNNLCSKLEETLATIQNID